MKTMRDYSGFRQEISLKSSLGKLLRKTALRFRKASRARDANVVQRTVSQWMGYEIQTVRGTFIIQPNTQSISFNGSSVSGVKYEYVYGKLTVEHNGSCVPARKAVKMFTDFLNRVNAAIEFIETNSKGQYCGY